MPQYARYAAGFGLVWISAGIATGMAVAPAWACVPAGVGVLDCSGTYTVGIDETASGGLVLRAIGVDINRTGDGQNGIVMRGSGTVDFLLSLDSGTVIKTDGEAASAAKIVGVMDGRVEIVSSGRLVVRNGSGLRTDALEAHVQPGGTADIHVRNAASGIVETHGEFTYAVSSHQDGTGASVAVNEGKVVTHGDEAWGVFSHINHSSSIATAVARGEAGSSVATSGVAAIGVYALNYALGGAEVVMAGDVFTTGESGDGVLALINNSDAHGAAEVQIKETATLRTEGNHATGGWVLQEGLGQARIVSEGSIETFGKGSVGLLANVSNFDNVEELRVSLEGSGSISTSGNQSEGVFALHKGAGLSEVALIGNARVHTLGAEAHGVRNSSAGIASVVLGSGSSVAVDGVASIGLLAKGANSASVNSGGAVSAGGEHGIGVIAQSDLHAEIVLRGGSAIGGWQSDLAGLGAMGLPSAGVMLDGITNVLDNSGRIGAASDRAIANGVVWDAALAAGQTEIINSGEVTGYLRLAGTGANSFDNQSGGTLNLRHFADSDGDAVRDTKRVAISDFGAGGGSFDNQTGAVLRLDGVNSATLVDGTGYYRPTTGVGQIALDAGVYDFTRDGIVQAQMVHLNSFSNAGTIDLRGTAIGNVLVMTSAATAADGPGTAVYTSNGGSLRINTVFNAGMVAGGGAGSISDVLVLDRTALGSAATTISIGLRDGVGGQTGDNGILLVEVRDMTASAPGVFVLAGDYVDGGEQRIIKGAYSYGLYHHGTGADAADGNWYLRSRRHDTGGGGGGGGGSGGDGDGGGDGGGGGDGDGGDGGGGGDDGDGGHEGDGGDPVLPFSPNLPIFEVSPAILQTQVTLGTLHQRVGNRYWREIGDGDVPVGIVQDDNGTWTRVHGLAGFYSAQASTVSNGHSVRQFGFETGVDTIIEDTEWGRLVGGLSAHYTQMNGSSGAGSLSAQGAGIGATLTYYGATGFYVDAQGRVGAYLGDYGSDLVGSVAKNVHGASGSVGVEAGQRIAVDEKWALSPQLQAIYTSVGLVPFTDAFGAEISIKDGHGLRGRLGLMAEYEDSWLDEGGKEARLKSYGGINYYRELLSGTSVQASEELLRHEQEPDWVGVALGGSLNWGDDAYSLHGEIGAGSSLRSFGQSGELKASLGFRKIW